MLIWSLGQKSTWNQVHY